MQATHFQCCHNHSKSICFQETVSTISGTNIHYLLDSCHVTVGSSHSSYYQARFAGLAPYESEDKIFFICHMTT